MSSFLVSHKKEECCGCSACVNVCPHQAISMFDDDEGFRYPQKNDRCIDCGLCELVCPYSPSIERKKEKQEKDNIGFPKTFAAYSDTDRIGSSSGGVFYTMAKYVIGKNGTVYGAAFDENFQLRHISARTIKELEPLRGSKYLQSNLGFVFSEVRERLKNKEQVMFVGTPCQVAGLKSFLRRDYDTLYTLDLICHGVPSQWMFDQHKAYLEKKNNAKLISYHFRNNAGWGGCEIASFVNTKTGKIKKKILPSYELSPYLYSFMYAFDYRLSCYECPFSKIPRTGDVTLGDYWGVQNVFPEMNISYGVSSILVNTPQGNQLWNAVKDSLVFEESDHENVCKENKNLITHSEKPLIRDVVYKMVKEKGYAAIAQKDFRSPRYSSIQFRRFLDRIGVIRLIHSILVLFKIK